MKISVKVNPNAKRERVEKIDERHFIVSVKEPPIKGRANIAIIEALAAHFNISSSRVRLVAGFSSREKIFEIM